MHNNHIFQCVNYGTWHRVRKCLQGNWYAWDKLMYEILFPSNYIHAPAKHCFHCFNLQCSIEKVYLRHCTFIKKKSYALFLVTMVFYQNKNKKQNKNVLYQNTDWFIQIAYSSPKYYTINFVFIVSSLLILIKGALENILKFSFWWNFIYHVKIDC